MRKIDFVVGNFYHIYNRGVEKRDIFLDEKDFYRFIDYLYIFNDEKPMRYYFPQGPTSQNREREKIVGVLCYALLPNHFHLILTPLKDGGITQFMRKLLTGYVMYFNEKYKRTGTLFESKFKAKIIENDAYFCHSTRYIHLNSLKLIMPEWKEEGVKNWERAIDFLVNYKWSSLSFYLYRKNFLNIIEEKLVENSLEVGLGEKYLQFLKEWLPNSNCEVGPRK
ncbi:MAG: hypothetical protein NZ891_07580 [bacterium]|nr:hypothetical protein [bacterium]MDW8164579.1 hypothetical protein [Candidatus Omnitrophota bacterium]